MTQQELFTPEAAGRYLGGDERPIPHTTLQWWRSIGQGPRYIKVGRAIRYRRSDLDAFMEASLHEPEEVRPAGGDRPRPRLTERA